MGGITTSDIFKRPGIYHEGKVHVRTKYEKDEKQARMYHRHLLPGEHWEDCEDLKEQKRENVKDLFEKLQSQKDKLLKDLTKVLQDEQDKMEENVKKAVVDAGDDIKKQVVDTTA